MNFTIHRGSKWLTSIFISPKTKFCWKVVHAPEGYYWAQCFGPTFTLGFCQIVSPSAQKLGNLLKKIHKLEYFYCQKRKIKQF